MEWGGWGDFDFVGYIMSGAIKAFIKLYQQFRPVL